MATWTLFHSGSPLNTTYPARGVQGELSMASGVSMTYSTVDPHTLSFSIPGRHPQAADIVPLVSDVLAVRDDFVVQRFRVVSRSISWGSDISASFSCVSYKALVNAWIFHDDSGDKKRWPTADGSFSAHTAMWDIVNYGQSLAYGTMGMNQGHVPALGSVLTAGTLDGVTTELVTDDYFAAGSSRGEALNHICNLSAPLVWDIEPNPSQAYNYMLFHVWRTDSGDGRWTDAPFFASPLALDYGGSVLSGTHSVDPSEVANVGRFAIVDQATNTTAAVWYPSSKNPAPVSPATDVPEGRWERDYSSEQFASSVAATQAASTIMTTVRKYRPVVSLELRRGRWEGPEQLWLKDNARVLIRIDTDGDPESTLLDIDEVMKVVEMSISVDQNGAEDVQLTLNRPNYSADRDLRSIYDRLARRELR